LKKNGKLVSLFRGEKPKPPPLWLMRQAGRYLPEYRAIRTKVRSFWEVSQNPELAAEITLQPVRRFDFDAAIIFSDIFVVPVALGIDVTIEEGIGPRLEPIKSVEEIKSDENLWITTLAPVYQAISDVRERLPAEKALIGFAGGPWTLATYLAEGRGSQDQRAAKLWGYRDPPQFGLLLERLADAVARHLGDQIRAGADVVQIFDSWSAGLTDVSLAKWVIEPTRKIVQKLRVDFPEARIIGFPRAASLDGYLAYAARTGVDAVSIDTAAPISWATSLLGKTKIIQGNLDPIALLAGGDALARAVDNILDASRDARLIFNLGHGILPETPVSHVEALVDRVRRV
jgi:uroporphyrinogen decarboxylase